MSAIAKALTAGNGLDHFIQRDGQVFAGTHLLIDIWEASGIDDIEHVRRTLVDAAAAAGATLLNIDLHYFTENAGVSGVAVLAESHISIHTWPEIGYASLDVFTCGHSTPRDAVSVLECAFAVGTVTVSEFRRGVLPSKPGEPPKPPHAADDRDDLNLDITGTQHDGQAMPREVELNGGPEGQGTWYRRVED
ncbi:adenosylmethionine decarboxylase [Rhodovibrio sodomensis]|uniref:S-adenosylmethionine decarboxylase proenzyme n=1 Tax=Rhodovibrio sodomensis TaxID=1088 RepID=A0ABS1DAX0_9PROT|nr:adenosylmethionine decarboxylase [Rhodovibrio sodomensis]MBK1667056.1 adenosylmethionine decarboxylase [Rhodovibrio sodomensis]